VLFIRKINSIMSNRKIVFTNGVFDLIHVGHIYLFEEAKKLGYKLVVGLNSDKSATKIKRKPVNNQKERKRVLKAIKYIDEVRIFSEVNPLSLIRKVRPDILIKGGDYIRSTVIGHEFVESYGGKVVVIPTLKGNSTTKTIKKIKSRSFKKGLPKNKGGYLS